MLAQEIHDLLEAVERQQCPAFELHGELLARAQLQSHGYGTFESCLLLPCGEEVLGMAEVMLGNLQHGIEAQESRIEIGIRSRIRINLDQNQNPKQDRNQNQSWTRIRISIRRRIRINLEPG
jgi:hypothetical protein